MLLLWGIFILLGKKKSPNLSGKAARLMGPALKKKNLIARRNLTLAFPEKSPQEIEEIIRGVWENLGRIPAEYAHFKNLDINNPEEFEIIGREHVEALRRDNQPGILVAGHLANWGIVSIATLQCGLPITQFYRRFNNKFVDWMVNKAQYQGGMKTLWKGADGGKEAYKLLKKGEHLVAFLDQKLKEGIPLPFFGREAMTAPGIARLALKLKCPIVPVRVERLERGKFRVTYYPPLKMDRTQDIHEATRGIMLKINQLFEGWIREKPEQWLWVHNRWPKL